MAHGTPDWGVTAGRVTTYQLTDLGELAARLGSPITFDRRGDVIWWDDFECGFSHWLTTPSGAGATAALSTARARNGRTSALLVAGSDANHSEQMVHRQAVPTLSRLGSEFSFSLDTNDHTINLIVRTQDGTTQATYSVRWDGVLNVLQYQDSGAALVTFATNIILPEDETLFNTFKLVVDASTGQYVRFLLNESSYSLSGIGGRVDPVAAAPMEEVFIVNTGLAGFNAAAYIDDVILTQNEPA